MKRRILVVDDEINIQKSIHRLFRNEGYEIFTADDGRKALDVIAEHGPFGVVISDQRMPNMTGTELLVEIRRLYPKTLRILLTGFSEIESITEAVNQGGIYKFLSKPWDDEELKKAVESAFFIYDMDNKNDELKTRINKLNQDLEDEIAQKSRVLNVNLKSLQVSQDILDSLPVYVVCVSDDGVIVEANSKACQYFADGHALVGLPFSKVLPEYIVSNFSDASGSAGFHASPLEGGRTLHYSVCNFDSSAGASGFIVVAYEGNE